MARNEFKTQIKAQKESQDLTNLCRAGNYNLRSAHNGQVTLLQETLQTRLIARQNRNVRLPDRNILESERIKNISSICYPLFDLGQVLPRKQRKYYTGKTSFTPIPKKSSNGLEPQIYDISWSH